MRQGAVGGYADDSLLVRDLVLEVVESDWGSWHARLSFTCPALLNSSSDPGSNLEGSSGFHRVADPVVSRELDDTVVGRPAARLDVEHAHLVRADRIRAPVPRAAVEVHARVLRQSKRFHKGKVRRFREVDIRWCDDDERVAAH